jgi:hypothetical protein
MADRRMTRGVLCSVILHGALLALLLPRLLPLPPLLKFVPPSIPIDLVAVGEESETPPARQKVPVPQQKAPEIAPHPSPRAVPLPTLASPTPAPGDALTRKLQELAQLQQPIADLSPEPNDQDGVGQSNVTAGSANAKGRYASYGIKDYLRAQIEKRWIVNGNAMLRNDWVVRLHLQIDSQGKVDRAEIVDDPRLRDEAYRDFALSARNAALLASPLSLPPELAEQARDLVLDFNPRRVLQ